MAVYTVSISDTSNFGDVNVGDGSTFASLSVSAGRGPKGDGFTGGTYDASTGIVTFTSNDGIGFSTDDLRGNLSEPGPIGDVTPNTGAFTTLSSTGDTVIGGNLTVEGTTGTFSGDLTVDTNTLYVDSANNRVGIGTSSPATALDVTGTVTADGLTVDGDVRLDGGSSGSDRYLRFTEWFGGIQNIGFYLHLDGADDDLYIGRHDTADTNVANDKPVIGIDRSTGDISFYEDTGTTPKFFWDASAERLELGDSVSLRGGSSSRMVLAETTAAAINWLEIQSSTTGRTGVIFSDGGSGNFGLIDYDHTDDHLKILTASSEAMRIDSSGNVGIGTSSPSVELEVAGSGTPEIKVTDSGNTSGSEYALFRMAASDGNVGYVGALNGDIALFSANELKFSANSGEAMRIDSSGNVGIGTSSPSGAAGKTLALNGGTNQTRIALKNSVTGDASGDGFQIALTESGEVILEQRESFPLRFSVNASEAMRIDSSGNLLVGTTSMSIGSSANSSDGFGVRQDNVLQIARSSTGSKIVLQTLGQTAVSAQMSFVYGTSTVGSIQSSSTTTSYNTSSDERLKENIADAQPASDLIDSIQVREFDWKADGEHQRYGMVAQELETVAPEAVTKGETEDDMWSVDYSKLVPMLVKEIQDLRKRVDELET